MLPGVDSADINVLLSKSVSPTKDFVPSTILPSNDKFEELNLISPELIKVLLRLLPTGILKAELLEMLTIKLV